MRDDFSLFSHDDTAEGAPDPDIALITAFLARELSLVQFAAVEERLANDRAFRDKVTPIMDVWKIPEEFFTKTRHSRASGNPGSRLKDIGFPLQGNDDDALTPAQIDSGWQRFEVGQQEISDAMVLGIPFAREKELRRRSFIRIAATIVLVALPVAVAAQFVVKLITRNKSSDGSASASASGAEAGAVYAGNGDIDLERLRLSDAPIQLAVAGEQTQPGVPVVDVSAPVAKTKIRLGAVLGIKALSNGEVLVNDAGRRQLHLFTSDLSTSTLVLDSSAGSAASYGRRHVALTSFLEDSSLIGVDDGPFRLRVLDGNGRVARALALPVQGNANGPTYFDPRGRLVGRYYPAGLRLETLVPVPKAALSGSGRNTTFVASARGGGATTAAAVTVLLPPPDSLEIRRYDFETRRSELLGYVTDPSSLGVVNGGGKMVLVYNKDSVVVSAKQVINPLYAVDEWTVLSDGTIAIVRGQDYHVDWIDADGRRSSSAKLPFEWKLLTEEDKRRLVDSTRAAVDSLDSLALANESARVALMTRCPRGSACLDSARQATPLIQRDDPSYVEAARLRQFPYEIVPLSEIADYYPSIRRGSVKADADGNLWILPRTTTQSRNGELVYDVVNPVRGFVRRVRLPLGRSIAGFGKGGTLYLQAGDMKNGFTLERAVVPK